MQTQTKFTPGPWKLPAGVIGADKVWSEDQNGSETLVARGIDNEQDAKLISLAPEMLDALQRIADICAGDLRESLHGEAQTKFDFEAQLRTVRGHTIGLSAIASSILAKLNS